jgi:hypothetical protein
MRLRHGREREGRHAGVRPRDGKMGRRTGFPVLDLTPVLWEVTGRFTGEPYLLYDGHWNARGHRVAAGAVVTLLRTQGWLSACAASR